MNSSGSTFSDSPTLAHGDAYRACGAGAITRARAELEPRDIARNLSCLHAGALDRFSCVQVFETEHITQLSATNGEKYSSVSRLKFANSLPKVVYRFHISHAGLSIKPSFSGFTVSSS